MSSKYFTVPSFARAKKNKEDLEKTNPQDPILKDEDEKFLEKHMSTDQATEATTDVPPTKITDDGEEKEATKEEQSSSDQAVVPETQPAIGDEGENDKPSNDAASEQPATPADPETQPTTSEGTETQPATGDATQETEQSQQQDASYDNTMKEKAAERAQARKDKKSNKSFDLPSQEEAEAATKGFNAQSAAQEAENPAGEKRTWASYLSSYGTKKTTTDQGATTEQAGDDSAAKDETTTSPTTDQQETKTWTQKAATLVPSIPALPTSWRPSSRGNKDPDSTTEPVYNEDGTINEAATKEQQEKEISVLLDNLNMSAINNRVFAASAETQKYYERFALVLKDIINGAPTAYDDMDKLMKEAGPKLEQQFKQMPPFVQTLVKSLPARLGTTLGPSVMAAATEKPGNDMRSRMEAASKPGVASASTADGSLNSGANLATSETSETEKKEDEASKKKRRIPGLKSLTSSQGMVGSMLRNVVTFIQTRFPFLAGTTNVVMSLAVFILMFVFWYCHKRGKEVRLAKEAEAGEEHEDGDLLEVEVSDEEGEDIIAEEVVEGKENDVDENMEKDVDEKAEMLGQPNTDEVPLPANDKQAQEEKEEDKIGAL